MGVAQPRIAPFGLAVTKWWLQLESTLGEWGASVLGMYRYPAARGSGQCLENARSLCCRSGRMNEKAAGPVVSGAESRQLLFYLPSIIQ